MIKKTILNILIVLFAGTSHASETTGTLELQVDVKPYCEMSINPEMNFGVLSTVSDTTATNTVTVRCTKTTPYAIEIEAGASSNSDTLRHLLHEDGKSTIAYQLYQSWNGSSGNLWGTEASGIAKKGYATGNSEKYQITGVIKKEQVKETQAGDYSESVRILIKY